MTKFDKTALPFPIHRDTTALDVVSPFGTGDTGCLLNIMKDSTILIGPPPPIISVYDLPEWRKDTTAPPIVPKATDDDSS